MNFILLTTIAFFAAQTVCGTCAVAGNFQEISTATNSILAGRTFQSDEGTTISFGNLQLMRGNTSAFLAVSEKSVDGNIQSHLEFIDKDGLQIRMSKIVQAQVESTYAVTVSAPYNVLSIRPLDSNNVEFLSRDCAFNQRDGIHYCYVKTRIGGEVFSVVYKELRILD